MEPQQQPRRESAVTPRDETERAEPAPGPVMAWLLSLAASPAGATLLVAMALLEATVFPGPTEAVLIALTLARRERAWWYASLATGASVVGGVIGYHLGASLFDDVARPLLASYDMLDQVDTIARVFRNNASSVAPRIFAA